MSSPAGPFSNLLLSSLAPEDLHRLRPHLDPVDRPQGLVLRQLTSRYLTSTSSRPGSPLMLPRSTANARWNAGLRASRGSPGCRSCSAPTEPSAESLMQVGGHGHLSRPPS